MCCCGKPTINGQPGWRWQPTDNPSVYPVNPPDVPEGLKILYDEPGRCGGAAKWSEGTDSHSYHYRVVRDCGLWLYVRHGGPRDEKFRLTQSAAVPLAALDSDGRYWMLNAIYHAASNAERDARSAESFRWSTAVADKRVKTRKIRKSGGAVKVWIVDPVEAKESADVHS